METKYIQEFLVLAELESSYAAAEKLFVSQSTLVRHIQGIEEEFGVPLFDRSKRGFVLNDAGRIFVDCAKKIALTQDQCYKLLHNDTGEPNVIRLCAQGNILDLLVAFKKEYPQYIIDYHECKGALEKLRTNKVEIAFFSNVLPIPPDVIATPYYREEVLVVLYEDHPLAQKDFVNLEDLRGEKFVRLIEDDIFDHTFADMFSKIGFVQDVVATVPTGNDLLTMVEEQIGIAIIHGMAETIPDYPGLKCIPLNPRIQYDMFMCYKKDMSMSNAAEQFVFFAEKWIIMHKHPDLSLFR